MHNTTFFEEELRRTQTLLQEEIGKHNITKELLHTLQESYDRFVPHQLLTLLGKKDITEVELGNQVEKKMSVLFSDIRSFTSLSEKMSPQQNFNFINSYLSLMEPVIGAHGGIIDKYIGDAIMALYPTNADDAVKGSIGMLKKLIDYNEGRKKAGYQPIQIGIGLNTGFLTLGTVGGRNRMEGTVISDTVNLASRIESMTKNYGTPLLISEHTLYGLKDARKYCIRFIDRIRVKGKEQPQSVYEVFDNDPQEIKEVKIENLRRFEEALACYHLREIPRAKRLLENCLTSNPQDQPALIYLQRCDQYLKTGEHESTGELELTIEWKDSFLLDIPKIDDQHKQLLDQMNKLSVIVHQTFGEKTEEISKIMDFLDEYASVHFWTEEKLMREYDYPFYDEHKKQHEKFVEYFFKLRETMNQADEDRIYLTFQIQLLLTDWLVNHTTKTDKHFGRFLKGSLRRRMG